MPKHPKPPQDELPTIDLTQLEAVTGGAGMDMSAMLPMIMMMRGRGGSSAPAPAPAPIAPVAPKIMLNGVEQKPDAPTNGLSFTAEV